VDIADTGKFSIASTNLSNGHFNWLLRLASPTL